MRFNEEIMEIQEEIRKIKKDFSLRMDRLNNSLTSLAGRYGELNENSFKKELYELRQEVKEIKEKKKSWFKEKLDKAAEKLADLE